MRVIPEAKLLQFPQHRVRLEVTIPGAEKVSYSGSWEGAVRFLADLRLFHEDPEAA